MNAFRRVAVLVILLAVTLTRCGRRERAMPRPEDRAIESRLVQSPVWHQCREVAVEGREMEQAECGSHIWSLPVSPVPEDCDDMTSNHEKALRTLVLRPRCTDAVVERLQTVASEHPEGTVLNDLAAALYVRAQREDQPWDLVYAVDAAERALEKSPRLTEALFNRALALEALGFSREATRAWNQLRLNDSPQWAAEAAEHWQRLSRRTAFEAATQWPLNRQRLRDVLAAGDTAAVEHLIAPYPAAALRYVEEEVLPAWAAATSESEVHEHLTMARLIASALLKSTKDHYPIDIVGAIDRASARQLAALRAGHLRFAEARRLGVAASASPYAEAATLLKRGGSPLREGAELGLAVATSFQPNGYTKAVALLLPLENEAKQREHLSVLGRIHANHGFVLLYQSNYVDSLAQYDKALPIFERMNDGEFIANMHVRRSGVVSVLGHKELASLEVFRATRLASKIVDLRSRHILLGEGGAAALALGCPRVALHYQNEAIRLIQDEMNRLPADARREAIVALRTQLGIAMRARALIQLRLERHNEAQHDLQEAFDLIEDDSLKPDKQVHRAVSARMLEVKGQSLRQTDAREAVAAFSGALELTSENEHQTFRALLLAQRADAHRRAGDAAAAERDLVAAIALLHSEEQALLGGRQPGEAEAFWRPYFARFQDLYELVIGQLARQKRWKESFAYVERSRAAEPLTLALQLGAVPDDFRDWTKDGQALELDAIREQLPTGTTIIEYYVLADRTYVWMLSHRNFEVLDLPIGEGEIRSWATSLQKLAERRDAEEFLKTLHKPYAALVAHPLLRIEQNSARNHEPAGRLVFVPDKAMHGLPFAALRNASTGRHLVQDHAVAVAPSATFYILSLRRDHELTRAANPSALLIGDPAFDQHLDIARELARLPFARAEVEAIRRIYQARAEKFVDAQATAPLVLSRIPRSAVIHLACHVIANPKAPFRSTILLAPSPHHNGALEAEELLTHVRLDGTRLVVLSACSSVGETSVGPDGLAPLVRPFIAAGAPAVVGSLWKVGDPATRKLLEQFHRHYRDGMDADRALQQAQIDLLNERDLLYAPVFSWAGFQVVGYASSPFPAN